MLVFGCQLQAQLIFSNSSTPTVGNSPFGVVAADFNGDGKMDLACVNGNDSTLTVLTNNGSGGFVTSGTYAVGARPVAVAAADVNGDGKMDLICANQDGSSLSVLTNDGSGGFVLSGTYNTVGHPQSVVAADVNGNGKVDLVSATYSGQLMVFTNDGSGNFVIGYSYNLGVNLYAVTTADVNGDGKIDLICEDSGNDTFVFTNSGNVTFGLNATYTVGNGHGWTMVAADFNGDGKVDLACVNASGNSVSVLTNNGSGSFVTSGTYAVGTYPLSVIAADVNGDGRLDLVCPNSNGSTLTVLTNDGSGGFVLAGSFTVGNGPIGITAADVNGDGKVDLICANSGSNTLSVLTNGTAFPPPSCYPPPSGLVGWWKGDGNGNDSAGTNNAMVPAEVTYAPAEVGLGFSLDGQANQIIVPDAPELNFSSNQDFSIEVWIQPLANPGNWQDIMSIIDKRIAPDTITQLGYTLSLQTGVVGFHMDDVLAPYSWNNFSAGPDLRDGKFHHVAVTVQRNSTAGGHIYIDGQVVLTFDPTVCPGDLSNTGPFRIGNHATPGLQAFYHGIIDEVSLYNCALTTSEIQSVYNAGSAGKCAEPLPPGITVQPSSQISVEGSNIVLLVTASGTGPFSYQWNFNGTKISGATNATLTLTDLHPYQSGNYTVTVTTPYGTITSAGASVTVIAQTILIYDYSGVEKCTTAGHVSMNAYSGRLFFIPATTNGTFVGWSNERGIKQYWVNPFSDYLLISVAGEDKHTITVLGQAGQGVDTNGYPHLWFDLHKGQNTELIVARKECFSFPAMMTDATTRIYPDAATSNMVLDEANSFYTFLPDKTQDANNNGQTMEDLVNALVNSLTAKGYKSQ
jgi:hypothetical protein